MKESRGLLTILCFIILHSCLNAQQWPPKEWPIVTPQSQNISADSLKTFDEDISKGKYGYIDGMIVTRHGQLVYQKSYKHDYDKIYGEDA